MKNFMKRMSLVLTTVLMAFAMMVSASASSANQSTACGGNSTSAVKYYVSGSGCLSGTDLNALLGKLSSSGGSSSAKCQTYTNAAVQGTSTSGSCPTSSAKASDSSTTSNCPTVSGSGTAAKSGKSCTDLNSILKQFGLDTTNSSEASATQTPETSGGNVSTPTPIVTPAASSGSVDSASFESQVVTLVNQQRESLGLAPLTLSTELSNVAQTKSQDMSSNNYFSHTSPTYGSPFDMLTSFGISYSAAGENIAMGYTTPEAVMNAWMNSPGHRANILSASYTQIGVGYVASGNYWTQEFIG